MHKFVILNIFLGLIAKMKDTAENAAQKIQAKAESVRFKTSAGEVTIRRKVKF